MKAMCLQVSNHAGERNASRVIDSFISSASLTCIKIQEVKLRQFYWFFFFLAESNYDLRTRVRRQENWRRANEKTISRFLVALSYLCYNVVFRNKIVTYHKLMSTVNWNNNENERYTIVCLLIRWQNVILTICLPIPCPCQISFRFRFASVIQSFWSPFRRFLASYLQDEANIFVTTQNNANYTHEVQIKVVET